jgi:hypothetical protein
MMSPWYQQIFRTRLAAHRQAVQEFITKLACCEEAIPRDYRDDRVKGVLLVVSGRDQSGADAGVKADLLVDGAAIGLEGGACRARLAPARWCGSGSYGSGARSAEHASR